MYIYHVILLYFYINTNDMYDKSIKLFLNCTKFYRLNLFNTNFYFND